MDRNATVLYLQNVRDLEVARYKLKMCYQQEEIQYDRDIRNAQATNYWAKPEPPLDGGCLTALGVIMSLLSLFSFVGLFIVMITEPDASGFAVMLIISFIVLLFFGIPTVRAIKDESDDKKRYKAELEKVEQHNKAEEKLENKRQKAFLKVYKKWETRQQWYQEESARLEDLLDSFYNMNVLPVQFRTLPAVCYIYDYMSTSRETLTTALFDQHLEDGIQRLEAKLSQLIDQLDEVVYQTRCTRENSERAIAQNNRMLSSLRRTEANSLEAAHYAQLSANYSKANAYFSLADYLKD